MKGRAETTYILVRRFFDGAPRTIYIRVRLLLGVYTAIFKAGFIKVTQHADLARELVTR
jgi:hypothetical protein